jgi:hypothetical protein
MFFDDVFCGIIAAVMFFDGVFCGGKIEGVIIAVI